MSPISQIKLNFQSVLLCTVILTSTTHALITLVSQFSPSTGNNRYADIWGEGDYAYIGSNLGSGVGIIDISTPSAPLLTAYYDPPNGRFLDIKVQNGVGYFASSNGGGLHIVDLSDPENPQLIYQINSMTNGYDDIHNVFVDGDFLYEADSETSTVKVFNVSNPSSPFFVRNIVTTDSRFVHDITVLNNRLYTSGFGGTTDIFDVTSIGSTAPALLGTVNSGANSHSNWVTSDNNLLVSAREILNGDVKIFDISNPNSPSLLSTITAASLGIEAFSPHNVILFNDHLLFISWYQAGLQVVNISDPGNPILVGSFDTFTGSVSGFDGNFGVYPFLGLGRILLSDVDGGLFIVDATSVADSDADQLNDDWEKEHFGDLRFNASDAPDGDGISNLAEFEADSDPFAFKVDMHKGWNLLSITRQPRNNSIEMIFGGKINGSIWTWDNENKRFKTVDTMIPLLAYWVFSNDDYLNENAIIIELP